MENKDLTSIRQQIDAIDDQMVALYLNRLELVGEVARAKAQSGAAVDDPNRERAIVYRLAKDVPDDNFKLYIDQLYSAVFTTSKSYQRSLLGVDSPTAASLRAMARAGLPAFPVSASVACQGVEGANSSSAAAKLFPMCDVTYFRTFEGVFGAVESGLCTYGVLPIDNSTTGSVIEVYDLMKQHRFHIVKSVRLKIDHCLAAVRGAKLDDIKTVVSHPQALQQCGDYLRRLKVETRIGDNTAVSAKQLAACGDKTTAVLCSEACAKQYGLDVLEYSVQDNKANYTRFICIGRKLEVFSGSTKISVSTTLDHRPGSLVKTLSRFAALGLDLTKIESRPLADKPFRFCFYLDFDGDVLDDKIISLIAELESQSDGFLFLGSYREVL